MPFYRQQFASSLILVGGSLLTLGFTMLLVKLFVWLAWQLAVPTLLVGLIAIIIGWILR